jgi:prepilin-type N-terminal cleavage/methylation domain-containing protein
MSAKKGFTLIEILVVLVIIGILAAVAIPNYNTMIVQGAVKTAQNNLTTIYTAQKNYYFNNGVYCIAGCNSLSNINLPANLNLNITDNNFSYACAAVAGPSYTCTATNISDTSLILTVTGGTPNNPNPIVLPGASGTLNPSCATDVAAYCPN